MLAHATTLLLQLRVFRPGLLQDGDVGVGVFPEGEEIFAGGESRTRTASAPCEVLDCKAFARATLRCANAPVQQFQTTPLSSMIFRNSAAPALPTIHRFAFPTHSARRNASN